MISDGEESDEPLLDELFRGGESDEELEEDTSTAALKAKWKDVPPSTTTSFKVNSGRKLGMDRGCAEVKFVQSRIQELFKKSLQSITKKDIINLFFGDSGMLTTVLKDMLPNKDMHSAYNFLATFCLQNIVSKDCSTFYDILTVLDVPKDKFPLDKVEYDSMWKGISKSGELPADTRNTRRPIPAWEKLQQKLNEILRLITVETNNNVLSLVVDDDKVWLNNKGANSADRFKLKLVRHTKDNRDGLNAHTAVTSAMTIPANIQFEKEGDSAVKCYERAMSDLTLAESGDTIDEHKMETFTDRGYTKLGKVERSLKHGGDIIATVARSEEWGITYEQKLKPGDKRKLISTKGTSSLIVQATKVEGKNLTLAAFKNGTESVCLAISSKHVGHAWEGIPFKNQSAMPSEADYVECIFQSDAVDKDETKIVLLDHMRLHVKTYTIQQTTADWHLLRKFSYSSSQAWASFNALFVHMHHKSIERISWEKVARCMRGDNWRTLHLDLHEREGSSVLDISKEAEVFNTYFTEIMDCNDLEDNTVRNDFIHKICDTVQSNTTLDDRNAKSLVLSLGSDEDVKWAWDTLSARTGPPGTPDTLTMRKGLVAFLRDNNDRRKYYFHGRDKLASTCTKYGAKKVSTANTEKTIITRLLDYEKNVETSNELPPDESDDEVKCREIRQLLERSFQTRFTGAKRAACDVGHKMEPKLAQNFIKDVNGGKLDSACNLKRVLGAYTTGLAGKRSCPHVKDSIDLILVVEVGMDDGSTAREVWGCEMKTRVARNTMVEEIAFQRKKHGPDATEDSVYTTCHHNFLHDQVHKLSERCQLLHHAYVYNLDKIVYLVRDNMGEILHGNIITFDEEILTSYGKVLQDMYDITLSWAYEEGEEENDCFERIVVPIAVSLKNIGGKDEFHSVFYLWKHVSSMGELPLPPLRRILPAIHAAWNAFKSGSDVTTGLIENHRFQHPYTNYNSRAVYRLLMVSFVAIHRILQIRKCRPETHETLMQLKNAATKRQSFHQTLKDLHVTFLQLIKEIDNCEFGSPMPSNHDRSRRSARLNLEIREDSPRTYTTPTKSRKRKEGDDSGLYWERIRKCRRTGEHPLAASEKEGRGHCWVCKNPTYWFCSCCHRYLCNDRITKSDNQKRGKREFQVQSFKQKMGETVEYMCCVETCYQSEHMQEAAVEEEA